MSKIIPEIIAHRGASYIAPENTLASVNLGWRSSDGVEIDIHLSKDGRIVVIHDDNTLRTAGRNVKVRDQNLAELQALDVGIWKGEKWSGEKIPALEEIFQSIPRGKRLFLEIKCGTEIIPVLENVLRNSGTKPGQIVIMSFSIRLVKAIKKKLKENPVYWLVRFKKQKKSGIWSPSVGEIAEKATRAGVDGLNVMCCEIIDRNFVKKVKEAGLKLYVWTVDSPSEAERLIHLGVEGITSNRPELLRKELKSGLIGNKKSC